MVCVPPFLAKQWGKTSLQQGKEMCCLHIVLSELMAVLVEVDHYVQRLILTAVPWVALHPEPFAAVIPSPLSFLSLTFIIQCCQKKPSPVALLD